MKSFQSLINTAIWAAGLTLWSATAHASLLTYDAFLDGPSESPPNASPATGFAQVIYDTTAHTLSLDITYSGLLGTTTASHIHAATTVPGTGTAGVATTTPYFSGWPVGTTSGHYVNTLDLTLSSSYNGSYITGNGGTTASAEAALVAAIAADRAYLNIHSTVFGGGEIRGFLVLVPEPSSAALMGLGAAVLALRRRKTA
jgi:hypothetical protein